MLFEVFAGSSAYIAYQIMISVKEENILRQDKALTDGTQIEKLEGIDKFIEITHINKYFEAPMYFNIGFGTLVGLSIPISSDISIKKKEKTLLTVIVKKEDNKENYIYGRNFLDVYSTSPHKWINDIDTYKNYMKYIGKEYNSIPAYLPMKIYEVIPSTDKTIYTSNKWKYVSADKNKLVKEIISNRRFAKPGFFGFGCLALISSCMLTYDYMTK